MSRETELKLAIAPDDLKKVQTSSVIKRYAKGRSKRRKLNNTYFDTPDLDLIKKGVGLRIRHEGTRWLQTAKTVGRSSGGLHARNEYECELKKPSLDFSRLVSEKALSFLQHDALQDRIAPVFETLFWRTTWDLELPDGSRVEMALDHGVVHAGTSSTPICEIELELKRGSPELLFELASELSSAIPLKLESQSKAHRGYNMLRQSAPQPVKAVRIRLKKKMTTEDAFSEILWNCLQQVQDNEAAILLGADPEGVHQMRVGLRRFRSCLTLHRKVVPHSATRHLQKRLAWLSEKLGPARNWDVFLAESLSAIQRRAPENASIQGLVKPSHALREQHYASLRAALGSQAYSTLMLDLSTWVACRQWRYDMTEKQLETLHRTTSAEARALLERNHRRVVKTWKHSTDEDLASMHRLRIAVKKQRYAVDFYRSLFSETKLSGYLKGLKQLQKVLGNLNDSATADSLINALPFDKADPTTALIKGWCLRSEHECFKRLPNAWKVLMRKKCFWR